MVTHLQHIHVPSQYAMFEKAHSLNWLITDSNILISNNTLKKKIERKKKKRGVR